MTATEQSTLFVNEGPDAERPEGACVNWDDCSNYPPGHPDSDNKMCDDCLDAARWAGRGHDFGDDRAK